MSSSKNDKGNTAQPNDPLIPTPTVTRVSSRTGVPLDKTAYAYLHSSNHQDNETGMTFVRKVMALLVLQYAAVLLIVSPFCLIDRFQTIPKPLLMGCSFLAFCGIVASVGLVLWKGDEPFYARASLWGITVCLAVGIGLKLSMVSWANYALVALGQATTSFALVHAIVQFDSSSLKWLTYKTVGFICLIVSGMWILVLRETKSSWKVAVGIGLGGWLYSLNIILRTRRAIRHREPHDYFRATIFILAPPIPKRCIRKQETSTTSTTAEQTRQSTTNKNDNYGGVDNNDDV